MNSDFPMLERLLVLFSTAWEAAWPFVLGWVVVTVGFLGITWGLKGLLLDEITKTLKNIDSTLSGLDHEVRAIRRDLEKNNQ